MNVVGQGPALAGEDSINVRDEYVSQTLQKLRTERQRKGNVQVKVS